MSSMFKPDDFMKRKPWGEIGNERFEGLDGFADGK
jgi:hypothetical protein